MVRKEEMISKVMDKYQNLIFSICLRITGDYFVSEDLTQETFIAIYSNLDNIIGEPEKSWICKIAVNKSVDYIRKSKKELLLNDSKACDVETIELFDGEDVIQKVKSACDNLPDKYAGVAIRYFINGLTAFEIAEETGKKLKTIQTIIYRSRKMLKKKLEDDRKDN